jgi:threonine synthase
MPITTSAGGTSAGDHCLRAIRESDGDAYAMERAAIEAAIRRTARDGVFLEPASANAVAGVEAALADGLLDPDGTVVCLGTGAGVKWPEHVEGAVGTAREIPPTLEALADAVESPIEP